MTSEDRSYNSVLPAVERDQSDRPRLSIRSYLGPDNPDRQEVIHDPDVRITIYDAAGLARKVDMGRVDTAMPRGLYRVHLDRCGFVSEHLLNHDSQRPLVFTSPLVESSAPIAIARDSSLHGSLAQALSVPVLETTSPLGDGRHDARLFIFVRLLGDRRPVVASSESSLNDAVFLSEPISIHDVTGHRLIVLTPDNTEHDHHPSLTAVNTYHGGARRVGAADLRAIGRARGGAEDHAEGGAEGHDPSAGFVALSCRIAPGTYRLRVGHRRRDLAITIPAQRVAQVFLADNGAISLRTARVYLPAADQTFDPRGEIVRAMESVLWVLSQPRGDLPAIARRLLTSVDRDLSFGVACAHLARRQRDRPAFDSIMPVLLELAGELPDVAVLERTWEAPRVVSPPRRLVIPPLFRASMVLALDHGLEIASQSALVQAAKTGRGDSAWCTWSSRWWDEQWIEPTVDELQNRSGDFPSAAVDIARSMRIPMEVVEHALANLDAGLPRVDGQPISPDGPGIPGYILDGIVGRGRRSVVFRAHRVSDGKEVAVKVMPVASSESSVARESVLDPAPYVEHLRLVRSGRCCALPAGAGYWLEMELCRESLLGRVARLTALGRPMGCEEACDAVLQALEALGCLHDRGFIHGHVHPGNLLVREDGSVGLALSGCRNCLPSIVIDASRDAVEFMAPESVRNSKVANPVSDVWSMGATLYFLLTLELPRDRFVGQSELDAARHNDVVPIADYRSEVPDWLTACLQRALSPVPAVRFANGNEFHEALWLGARSAVLPFRATRLYEELVARDPGFAVTIRNIFLRFGSLVDGEIAQRPILLDELTYEDSAENARAEEALQRFRDAGLIVFKERMVKGQPRQFVEAVHDELLRGWSLIREWLDELYASPEIRKEMSALEEEVRSWRAGERTSELRWSDRRAKQADIARRDRQLFYNAQEDRFLQLSRRRTVRRRVIGFAATVLPVLVVALWQFNVARNNAAAATVATNDARRARTEAETALTDAKQARTEAARSLQESGRRLVLDGYPLQALPYMLAAAQAGGVGPSLRMLFHAATRATMPILPFEHKSSVRLAAFSPDGIYVATASDDGTAGIWNALTGAKVASIEHKGPVITVAFSADGTRIITGSKDGTARIWAAATGWPQLPPFEHGGSIHSATFSADGGYVVTASSDHNARIWDARTGALRQTFEHRGDVTSAAFSPDGGRVVTANADGTARIWDVVTGRPVGSPLEHHAAVNCALFSSDGSRVVTASKDWTARVWDASTGKAITPPLEHQASVLRAVFDASGTRVVTVSDKFVRVWNSADGAPITPVLVHRSSVTSAAFSPNGVRLVTASEDHAARIWDIASGQNVLPVLEHTRAVTSAEFNRDGTRVVTASDDGTARIWYATGDQPPVVVTTMGSMQCVALSPDGRQVVTSSGDNTARIWDAVTGRLLRKLAHNATVRTIAISHDGERVFITSDDGLAQIWNTTTGDRRTSFTLPGPATRAMFNPEGTRIVIVTETALPWEDTLRMWDTTTGAPAVLPLAYPERVVSAAFSHDGKRIATVNRYGTAHVWDIATGEPLSPPLAHPSDVVSVAFNPDDTRVVTAARDRIARVWDTTSGKVIAPLLEHESRLVSASFGPDGARILTVDEDGTALVWDAITGKPLTVPLRHNRPIVAAVFSDDGERIVTADDRGIRTWDVSLGPRSQQQLMKQLKVWSDKDPEDLAIDSLRLQLWSSIAKRSPYVLENGVLLLRARSISDATRPRGPGIEDLPTEFLP